MAVYGPYPAVVTKVHDGDTITVRIDLGWNITVEYPCRVHGINAPELSTAAGKAAQQFALTLLNVGDDVSVLSHSWDKYAPRFDGSITLADGRDFAAVMVAAGHAAPYPTH